LIATGFVSSGLIDFLPAFLRFVLVFGLLSYLPGELLRRVLGRGGNAGATTRVAYSFLMGLSFYAIVAGLCQWLGVSFSTYLGAVQIVSFAFFGVFFVLKRDERGEPAAVAGLSHRGQSIYTLLVAVVLGCLYYAAPPGVDQVGEGYGHVAYVRAILSEDNLAPGGVLAPPSTDADSANADPRKGMFQPIVAAISVLTRIEPVEVWAWLPVVLAPLAVLVFASFASLLLPGLGYVVACLFLFVIFQGTTGLGLLAAVAAGRHLALVYAWLLFVLAVEYGRAPDNRRLVGLCGLLLGAAMISGNVLVHVGLIVLSLILFRKVFALRFHAVIKLGVGMAACGLIVFAWRAYTVYSDVNDLHALPQGLLYFFAIGEPHFIPSPMAIAKAYGLLFVVGLILVPGLLWIRRRRDYALMSLALSIPPFLIVLNPWLTPVIYNRGPDVLNAIVLSIPVWIVTTLILGSVVSWARRGNVPRKALAMVLVFVWAELLLIGARDAIDKARRRSETHAPVAAMTGVIDFIGARMPARSVLLSDPVTSLLISAYCDVKVVALPDRYGSPSDPVPFSRVRCEHSVLSEYTTLAEAFAAVEEFGVEYVLLNGTSEFHTFLADWDPRAVDVLRAKLGASPDVFHLVYDQDGFLLYEVDASGASDDFAWFPNLPFSEPPVARLSPCATGASAGAPRVTAIAVEPIEVLAGETIALTVGYQRDGDPPSPLPPVLHIRLEEIDHFRNAASYPGDRYVRTLRERRDGLLRHEIFHRPFDGLYTPELWPIGRETYETFLVRLPRDLREGTYELQIKLDYAGAISNAALKDLFFDSDSYDGTPCIELQVRHFLTR
jgi:hypothetical protein